MSKLQIDVPEVERVRKSIDLTRERFEKEGFTDEDDSLGTLDDFCKLLIDGGDVDGFLSSQDLEVPAK